MAPACFCCPCTGKRSRGRRVRRCDGSTRRRNHQRKSSRVTRWIRWALAAALVIGATLSLPSSAAAQDKTPDQLKCDTLPPGALEYAWAGAKYAAGKAWQFGSAAADVASQVILGPKMSACMAAKWDDLQQSRQRGAQWLYQSLVQNCWTCEIVANLFDVTWIMGHSFFDAVQSKHYVQIFVGVYLFYWIAYNVGRVVSPFGPPQNSDIWREFYAVFGWTAVVSIIAQLDGFTLYWDNIVTPVLGTFVGLGHQLLDAISKPLNVQFVNAVCTAAASFQDLTDSTIPYTGLRQELLCLTGRFHSLIGNGLVFSIVNLPTSLSSSATALVGIVLGSLVLMVVFGMAMLSLLTHLVEVMVRMMIAAASFPIALVAFIFPVSRHMAKTVVRMLIYSGVYLFLVSVLFSAASFLMAHALQYTAQDLGLGAQASDQELWKAYVGASERHVGVQNVAFWWLLGVGYMIVKMLGAIGGIADKFAEYGDGIGVGGHMARSVLRGVDMAGGAARGAGRMAKGALGG